MQYVKVLFFILLPLSAHATTLEEAINHALENNLKVKAAEYKFLADKEQYSQALSLFLPSVTGTFTHDLDNFDGVLSPINKGITINQQVFNFGGDVAAYQKANKMQLLAHIAFLQAKQRVIFEAVQAYTNVLEKTEVKKLYDHNVGVIGKHLEASKQRFMLGEITKTDLEKNKARLSAAKSEKIKAEGELSNAYANYLHTIGVEVKDLEEPHSHPVLPLSLSEAMDLSAINNLSLKSSNLMHESAELGLTEAYSRALPSVSASVGLSEGLNGKKTALLSTNIPLFQGGASYFKVKQAKYALEQAKQEYQETERTIEETINMAWNNFKTAESILESSRQEVDSMAMVAESQQEARKLNLSTIIDVIDAENDLLAAKSRNVGAKMKYIVSMYNLVLLTDDIEELFN